MFIRTLRAAEVSHASKGQIQIQRWSFWRRNPNRPTCRDLLEERNSSATLSSTSALCQALAPSPELPPPALNWTLPEQEGTIFNYQSN